MGMVIGHKKAGTLSTGLTSRLTETRLDVFHEQVKVHFIRWRWLETETAVERPRRGVFGVNEHSATADQVGCLRRAQEGVFQQSSAQPLALSGHIHTQPGEQDDGDRMP